MTDASLEPQGEDDADILVRVAPRAQRLASMIVTPLPILAVAPIMRSVQGDGYSPFTGVLIGLLLLLILPLLRLKVPFGAEWVVRPEWRRRMTVELTETSPWPVVLAVMAGTAITLLGFVLIVTPRLDQLDFAVQFLAVAFIAATGLRFLVVRHFLLRILQGRATPAGDDDEAGYALTRRYPLLGVYVVSVSAALIGVAAARQFDRVSGATVYVFTVLAWLMFWAVLHLWWRVARREPSPVWRLQRTPARRLQAFLLWGLLVIAVPLAVLGAGLIMAETMGLPPRTLIFVDAVISEAVGIPPFMDACIAGYGVTCLFGADVMFSVMFGLYVGTYLTLNPIFGFPEFSVTRVRGAPADRR